MPPLRSVKRRSGIRRIGQLVLLVGIVTLSCGQAETQDAGTSGAEDSLQVAQAGSGTQAAGASSGSGDKPNIIIIWGDDIGQSNLSTYTD